MEENSQFKWGVVLVACIAIFIIVLDSSAMNVSISAVIVDLNTDLSTIQALIAIYALTIASFMLTGSKLQDVLGRKKTFFAGVIIYGIGTTTAALSVNVFMLFIGWSLLEGIGAALMFPATTTMVSAAYEGKDRLTAFGIWGGIAAMGAAIGPLYGGALTSFASWRFIFAGELLGVIAVIVMRSYLRESKPSLTWRDIDLGGRRALRCRACLSRIWHFAARLSAILAIRAVVHSHRSHRFCRLPPLAKAAYQSPRGTVARHLCA